LISDPFVRTSLPLGVAIYKQSGRRTGPKGKRYNTMIVPDMISIFKLNRSCFRSDDGFLPPSVDRETCKTYNDLAHTQKRKLVHVFVVSFFFILFIFFIPLRIVLSVVWFFGMRFYLFLFFTYFNYPLILKNPRLCTRQSMNHNIYCGMYRQLMAHRNCKAALPLNVDR
jgi:hypothetical protein